MKEQQSNNNVIVAIPDQTEIMAEAETEKKSGGIFRFLFLAGGIFVFFFFFGVMQEKITRGNYGEERFTHHLALVFTQCVVNYAYAVLMLKLVLDQGVDHTPNRYYAVSSFTYLAAMVSSNKALMWVNYPTQVVGKSCKPIPVMVLGVLFGGKKYPLVKYFFVLLIVIGVALFIYKDSGDKVEAMSFGFGEALLLASLTFDGLTGAVQERMKSEHQSKSGHMMRNMNLYSIAYLGVALVATGEIWAFAAFVGRHPTILGQLALFSVASALGQYFIFMCVAEFGPLPCSIATTTRKFFTVLFSVLFFGNALITRQWLGTALVFTGLFLDGLYGKQAKKPAKD